MQLILSQSRRSRTESNSRPSPADMRIPTAAYLSHLTTTERFTQKRTASCTYSCPKARCYNIRIANREGLMIYSRDLAILAPVAPNYCRFCFKLEIPHFFHHHGKRRVTRPSELPVHPKKDPKRTQKGPPKPIPPMTSSSPSPTPRTTFPY
ncbi:hypothetical protein L211DRAFT_262562 [Terfezia boudieri ATCC MYA-4762]|uniref:Uncharacterized protein n=1 Tax=Terfezia boudieri ATCC MYA-4762 TaxID=1051890 RepID=A0A3N4M2E2_9PEZI|nr:hypothetical protein L211DRAFT_262562 [Terfezia boudieri ATCC MYA-4762]